MQWIQQAQDTSADNYYFKPYLEDEPYKRLYVYQLSMVEKYSSYGYEIPEDRTKFYSEGQIPAMIMLDYVGEN